MTEHHLKRPLTALAAALLAACSARAAIPLTWPVDMSRVQPVTFEGYHGETIALEAHLFSYGDPFDTGSREYRIYWQTNGMGKLYFSEPATASSNVVTAAFTPEMDTGANVVRGFLGCAGEDFRASFQLRLYPSPGAIPNLIDLPARVIDFAQVEAQNAPWATVPYVEELFDKSQHPVPFVVSETAAYYYNGDAAIPSGYYYRATTGDGYVRYAAKVPMPRGRIVMSGDDDDPVLQYFGSVFRVSSIATRVTALSSPIDVGIFQVADLTFAPGIMLGLSATFHVNILNPVPDLTGIALEPDGGSLEFTDARGVRHYIYGLYASGTSSYGYTDETYDPNTGMWDSVSRTISVSYERDGDTEYGFAVFGGSPIATEDEIDTARSRLVMRTGQPGELGTGPGYKVYDFTDDERLWELRTPRLNVALSYPTTPSMTVARKEFDQLGIPRPDDCTNSWFYVQYDYRVGGLRAVPNMTAAKEVMATRGQYGADGCRYADYRVGAIAVDTNRTGTVANGRYAIELDATDIGIGVAGRPYLWGDCALASVLDGLVLTSTTNVVDRNPNPGYRYPDTEIKTTFYDFSPVSMTSNGYTRTATFRYLAMFEGRGFYRTNDGLYRQLDHIIRHGPLTNTFAVVLTTSPSMETTRVHAERAITDYNQHMFWDAGMKCTWETGVTNGLFWARKISTDDYRREEHVR